MDSIGSVRSMRGWVATAALAPYVTSVVEVAFGVSAAPRGDFGLTGGGELRREGSDWNWLCHSVGLWPMANSRGRWCSCVDEDQGFAWAWAILALALFGMGGDGPGRPGESRRVGEREDEEGDVEQTVAVPLLDGVRRGGVETSGEEGRKEEEEEEESSSGVEGLLPASPAEIGPVDGGESPSSAKLAPEKRRPGQHEARVDLLQKLRSRQEMVRAGASSSAADLQRLLRDAETGFGFRRVGLARRSREQTRG